MENKESKRADITVISKCVRVELICPHCKKGIDINYQDFIKMQNGYGFCDDWTHDIECPECHEMIEIGCIEWSND